MRILSFLCLLMYSSAVHAWDLYSVSNYDPLFSTPDDACIYFRDIILRTAYSGYKLDDTSGSLWCYAEYSQPGRYTGAILSGWDKNDPVLPNRTKRKKSCNKDAQEKVMLYVGMINEQRKLIKEYEYPDSLNGCDIEVTETINCWSYKNEIASDPNRPTYCEFSIHYLGTATPNQNADSASAGLGLSHERTETKEDGSIEIILTEENIIKNPDGSLRKVTVETRTLRRPDGSIVISPSTLTTTNVGAEKKQVDDSLNNAGGNTNNYGSNTGAQGGGNANNNASNSSQSGGNTNNNTSNNNQNGGSTNNNTSNSGQSNGSTDNNTPNNNQNNGSTNNNDSNGAQIGSNNKNPDMGGFCESNPTLTICKESKLTASCTNFSCEGDAIQCAIARRQYEQTCRMQEDRTHLEKAHHTSLGEQLLAGNDPLQERLPTLQSAT